MTDRDDPSSSVPDMRGTAARPAFNELATARAFREELRKDSTSQVFDERFAEDIARLASEKIIRLSTYIRTSVAMLFLLFVLLGQYELPLEVPYLSTSTASGLVDITLVISLLTLGAWLGHSLDADCYRLLLRIYCEERYDEKQAIFFMLRWNATSPRIIHVSEHEQCSLRQPWKTTYKGIEALAIIATLGVVLGVVLMIGLATWHVVSSPSFGIVSILLVLSALGYFLRSLVSVALWEAQSPDLEQPLTPQREGRLWRQASSILRRLAQIPWKGKRGAR